MVSAAHSVTRNMPPRFARYLTAPTADSQSARRLLSAALEVNQDDPEIWGGVGRRLRIWVRLRRPARDVARVVLVPVDALGDRDERDLVQHHLLDLVDDLHLLRLARAGVLVEERVGRRRLVALVVGGADVAAEEQPAELVVRARPDDRGGWSAAAGVRELEVAVLEIRRVGAGRFVLNGDVRSRRASAPARSPAVTRPSP